MTGGVNGPTFYRASTDQAGNTMSDQFLARANNGIDALAKHFPAVFAHEGWQPHRPLKIGINKDIAAAGITPAEDIGPTLRLYVRRLMYQRALAAGGSRYDLNGEPCGEVTAEQAAGAATSAAHIEAEPQTRGAAAIAAWKAKPRKVWKVFPDGHDANKPDKRREPEDVTAAPPLAPELAATPPTPTKPVAKRLGMADLRRVAQERRAGSRAHVQSCHAQRRQMI
jgi:sRNA-binding protein